MNKYQPTPKQEQAIREFLHEAVVPLIEDVLVKKLGQAMAFLKEQEQTERKWQGLTGLEQKELMAMNSRYAVFETEAKLKEKNG